jgi:hypothetical protein
VRENRNGKIEFVWKAALEVKAHKTAYSIIIAGCMMVLIFSLLSLFEGK